MDQGLYLWREHGSARAYAPGHHGFAEPAALDGFTDLVLFCASNLDEYS